MKPAINLTTFLLLPGALALATACGTGSAVDGEPDAMPPIPDAMPNCENMPDLPGCPDMPPPMALPAPYVRGSLIPAYELMGIDDLDKFEHKGVTPQLADYENVNVIESEQTQLQQLQLQIVEERNLANAALANQDTFPQLMTNVSLLPGEFSDTASRIPFRGKPTDVAFLTDVNGVNKAYVPLSGRWSVPGNEVVVVDYTNQNNPEEIETIQVGLRPIGVAADPETNTIFVCNNYSNYISVIDAINDVKVAEVRTRYSCSDILVIDKRSQVGDDLTTSLYVANEWLGAVLVYDIEFVENPSGGGNIIDVIAIDQDTTDDDLTNDNAPSRVIRGVGSNPQKLTLSQSDINLFVTNVRGGQMAVVRDIESYTDNGDGTWTYDIRNARISAPTVDIIDANNNTYVLTMMRDRGFPSAEEEGELPLEIRGTGPAMGMGVDGAMHVVHPGASFDDTRAYNFEDIRSGILQLGATLDPNAGSFYYVDDNDSSQDGPGNFEFDADERILAGAQPRDAVTNEAQDTMWVAYDGSEVIQVFDVVGGNPNVATLTPAATIDTHQRGANEGIQPYALAIDEDSGVLLSVNRGSGTLQVISLNNNAVLGTTEPFVNGNIPYPATNIERGEYLYADALWSNDGRKSCVSCHFDDQMDDGIPYANGATAPTVPHRVKPTWNLIDTGNYFWNGSFRNNAYTSVAFAAQTKTQCEIILFGFVEGITSDPATRIGDAEANNIVSADSENCRPVFEANNVFGGKLPDNFLVGLNGAPAIAAIIADERNNVVNDHIQAVTGEEIGVALTREEASQFSDWYGSAYRRLPANPSAQLYLNGHLDTDVQNWVTMGRTEFMNAGCASCHVPATEYQDGLNHGPGADWLQRFNSEYGQQISDDFFAGGGLPETFLDAVGGQSGNPNSETHVINYHYPSLDFFVPFCFDEVNCLSFDDPFQVSGGVEEDNRVNLLAQINIIDPDRQWIPGQPVTLGSSETAAVNTPTLRGIWWATNFLRHGFGDSIREAILAPGHSALQPGENGFAYADAANPKDVHGVTSTLSGEQVRNLILYVRSIPADGTTQSAFYLQ